MECLPSLQARGFVCMPYPPDLRERVQEAMKSWALFCGLPRETKEQFEYNGAGGFELKEELALHRDLKENFHVSAGDLVRLEGIASRTRDRAAVEFIRVGGELIHAIEPLIADFARSVEREAAIPGFTAEVLGSKGGWVLRYLHYFSGQVAGVEVATPHTDKGAFTLHLFEDHPGLQRLSWERQWGNMPVSEGETVIIAGMQLQFRAQSAIKALCHRVLVTPETVQVGRYSMVCFIPLPTHRFNKAGKGRLQEFPPGFNYDISYEEFRELFL